MNNSSRRGAKAQSFPLILRNPRGKISRGFIAWDVAELCRKRAERNHGQTLERLAERGGLSPFEAACALADSDLFDGIRPSQNTALHMLAGAAHALDRLRASTPSREPKKGDAQ